MTSGLLTSRMIARAVQSALDQGAVFALLKRERQWCMLQRRWDSAWRLRAPWELIFSGCLGYEIQLTTHRTGAPARESQPASGSLS